MKQSDLCQFLKFFFLFCLSYLLFSCSHVSQFSYSPKLPLPRHIALLVPLQGGLAAQGRAIRNGFLAAFYEYKKQGIVPDIQVVDTSQGNIVGLYQQVVQQGADFVVGPLLKNDIITLINHKAIKVPTLALNSLLSETAIKNLYQFGLMPEDEAQQVAEKIINNHQQKILIITSNNPLEKRIVAAFEKNWQALNGKVVGKLIYQNRKTLAMDLAQLLNIDQSEKRSKSLQYLFGEKLRFEPNRRKDFDAIFLVATPGIGRQILPLLRFYYVNDVPIYSTSLIYGGFVEPSLDNDLNGIQFDAMPWVASDQLSAPLLSIHNQIQAVWKNDFLHYSPFFALGIDAYQISTHFNALTEPLGLTGATGRLSLMSNQHIYRNLNWLQITNGLPVTSS